MFRMLHSWWQKTKQPPFIATIIIVVLFALIASIFAAYEFGWGWTGFNGSTKVSTTHTISGPLSGTVTRTEEYQPGKALWDWLQLLGVLAIPVVVGLGAVWFSYRQNLTTSRIAEDRQREDTLQAYFDKISELLFKEHLGDLALRGGVVPGYEEARKIARARTLTVLQRLDGERQGSVLRFLHESGLIDRDKPSIQMNGADLSGANLSISDLSGANLKEADLSEANLTRSDLSGTNLSGANLSGADLIGADLTGADLSGVNLSGASLSGASLSGVNLSGAELYRANLSKIRHWTTMPTTQWQILQNDQWRGLGEQVLDWQVYWSPLSVFRGVSAWTIIFKNGTNLSGANLNGADLSGADLSDANLERANLKEADLTRANLKEANLTEATMSRAKQTIDIFSLRWIKLPTSTSRILHWGETSSPKWADLEIGSPFSFKTQLLPTTEAINLLTKAINLLGET